MSLLGTPVYANTDTPLWLSVGGDTINGNLTVNGTIQASLDIDAGGDMSANDITLQGSVVLPGTTNNALVTTDTTGAILNLVAETSITMGRDAITPNTTLVVSAPGSGLDAFTTNFLYAIGPVPTSLVTVPKTINPVPVSPAPAQAFLVDTSLPTLNGAIYEVQATGSFALAAGVADPDDALYFEVDAGTGLSITTYTYYPSRPGQSANWSLRQRIVCNAAQPSLSVLTQVLRAGASTADYSATINYFSATRVA